MIEGWSHSIEQKINLTSWQREPHQSECDLYNSTRVGEANSPAVWPLPVLLATVIKGQNIVIKMVMWKCGDGKHQASAELWDTRHNSLFALMYALDRGTLSSLHCSQVHFEQPALFTGSLWAACTVHIAYVLCTGLLDTCQFSNGDCSHDCLFDYRDKMTFACTCPPGLHLEVTGRNCTDIGKS